MIRTGRVWPRVKKQKEIGLANMSVGDLEKENVKNGVQKRVKGPFLFFFVQVFTVKGIRKKSDGVLQSAKPHQRHRPKAMHCGA